MAYKSPVIKKCFLEKNETDSVMKIRYFEDSEKVEIEEIKDKDDETEISQNDFSEEIKEAESKLANIREEIEILKKEKEKELLELTAKSENEAENIIKKAQKKADEIIDSAENEKEKTIRIAHDTAFEKGYEVGRKKAIDQFSEIISRADSMLKDTLKVKKELLLKAENQVIKLALAVASKVIRYETSINSNIVVKAVRDSLKAVNSREKVKICVNPGDMPGIEKYFDEFAHIIKSTENLSISKDSSISKGGFIIETSSGNLDGQIETALLIIEEELSKVMAKNNG
jgi:flagellar assembly protein FliH